MQYARDGAVASDPGFVMLRVTGIPKTGARPGRRLWVDVSGKAKAVKRDERTIVTLKSMHCPRT